MKKDIHPKYNKKVQVSDASSGETFEVASTADDIQVEISYLSHPFYTGKEQLVDTAGRVDRFKKIVEQKEKVGAGKVGKRAKKERQAAKKTGTKGAKKTKPLKEAKASDLESK